MIIKTPRLEVKIFNIKTDDFLDRIYDTLSDERYSGYAVLIDDTGNKTFIHCTFSDHKGRYEPVSTSKLTGDPQIIDLKIEHDLPDNIYNLLVQEDMALAEIVDKVLVCPSCNSLPLVRPGCANCGGFNVKPDILVHHYSCGCVDHLSQFVINRETGSLTCHKCHKDGLIVNCDYDVSHGIQRCLDCGWTGNAPRLIGSCHNCDTMFLMSEAINSDVLRYTIRKSNDK